MASASTAFSWSERSKPTMPSSPSMKLGKMRRSSSKSPQFKTWDPATTDPTAMYKILMGGIVPRPIAFVSTLSTVTGLPILAPFCFVQMVSHDPPVVMLTSSRPATTRVRETAENIRRTGHFTVNIINDSLVGDYNPQGSSTMYVDEWLERGLIHWKESSKVHSPRVAESGFSMECELYSPDDPHFRIDPSIMRANIILGVVKRLHVRSDILNSSGNMVDPAKLNPVMRLGSTSFCTSPTDGGFSAGSPRQFDAKYDGLNSARPPPSVMTSSLKVTGVH